MTSATATAFGGQVRSGRGARALARGCWRLVILLGLSWAALLLLGGTAHAACDEPACDQAAGPAAPEAAADVPLVGKLLADAGDARAAKPLQQVADLATTAVDSLRRTTPATPDAAPLPAADVIDEVTAPVTAADPAPAGVTRVDAVGLLTNTVRSTADATGESLRLENVPSVRSTVTPLVDGLARQVVDSADAAVDAVEVLAAPLPLAGGLTETLRTAVGALEMTARLAVGATDAVTGSVDDVVAVTSSVLSPVVDTVTGPIGTGDAAGPATDAGPTPAPSTSGSEPVHRVVAIPVDAPHTAQVSDTRALSGPAVPPPDALDVSYGMQSAADTVTALPVPVSGAGSITGNGGAPSAPRPDHPLARVAPEPAGTQQATAPVECPAGAMPGTPAADPVFSPD